MYLVLKEEYQSLNEIPGYTRDSSLKFRCSQVYEEFKTLCANSRQPGTFIDYYKERFRVDPEVKLLKDIANIITWNIWQMDGLKGVVPYSCHDTTGYNEQMSLFETELEEKRLPCPGCEKNDMFHHNGIYCRIYDWNGVKKSIPYISLFKEGKRNG